MLRVIGFVSVVLALCFYGGAVDASTCDCTVPQASSVFKEDTFEETCNTSRVQLACFQNPDCDIQSDKMRTWLHNFGQTEAVVHLCANRQVFMDNMNCTSTAKASEGFRGCQNESTAEDDKCRRANEKFKCIFKAMKTACNEDVAKAYVKYMHLENGRSLTYHNCTVDTDYLDNGFSRLTSSLTSLLLLPLASLTLIGR